MKTYADNWTGQTLYVDSSANGWSIVSEGGKKLSGYYESCRDAMRAAKSLTRIHTLKELMQLRGEISFR